MWRLLGHYLLSVKLSTSKCPKLQHIQKKDDMKRVKTAAEKSFGWLRLPGNAGREVLRMTDLRLPTAEKSFGWLRLPGNGREVLRMTEITDGREVLRMTDLRLPTAEKSFGWLIWDYRRPRSPSDDWDYPATAEKSFGWLRLPTAERSFGWLRLPTAERSFWYSDWETEPVPVCQFTHAKRSRHRTLNIMQSMSEFDGLWKHQNNPACTKSVSLEPSVLKLDTQTEDEEPNH